MAALSRCLTCGKRYDPQIYSGQCPHRYLKLQGRLDAGESIPAATERYEDNPHWRLTHGEAQSR